MIRHGHVSGKSLRKAKWPWVKKKKNLGAFRFWTFFLLPKRFFGRRSRYPVDSESGCSSNSNSSKESRRSLKPSNVGRRDSQALKKAKNLKKKPENLKEKTHQLCLRMWNLICLGDFLKIPKMLFVQEKLKEAQAEREAEEKLRPAEPAEDPFFFVLFVFC